MMSVTRVTVAALALVGMVSAIAPLHRNDLAIDGKYIVVFKVDSTETDRLAHMTRVKAISDDDSFSVSHQWSFHPFHAYAATMSDSSLEKIRSDDDVVDFVEVESVYSVNKPVGEQVANVQLNPAPRNVTSGKACTKQDDATWGLVRIGQRSLPSNEVYSYDSAQSGEGVDAYIIDTGVMETHVDFEGRVEWGTDTADSPMRFADDNGHGTHVAGTILSKTWGVAKKARGIAVKVLGASGSGSTAGVIAGIDWTCSDHTAKRNKCVANMSLGGGYSAAMNRAAEALVVCGCSLAVASGNDNSDACNYSPASAKLPVVTVNSMTKTDSESSFSNHGSCTDIFAPGSSITSTWIGSNTATNTISGTSMASPHVAGVMVQLATNNDDPQAISDTIARDATSGTLSGVNFFTPNKLLFRGCE